MSLDTLVEETLRAILDDVAGPESATAAGPGLNAEAWKTLEDSGLPWVGLPEASGGEGGTLQDAADLAAIAAHYALAVPLAEHALIGGTLLAWADLQIERGLGRPMTVAPGTAEDDLSVRRTGQGWTLDGRLHRVPYADAAAGIVAEISSGRDTFVAFLPRATFVVTAGSNLAGEPRETVLLQDATLSDASVGRVDGRRREALGAAARSVQIAGALDHVLAMTVAYAGSRIQFGRPISSFQAVSHLLAELAEQAAMAQVAAGIGIVGITSGDDTQAAVAKAVCGRAATQGARLAHQVHGAIGVTMEYQLQLFTRRLLAWRDEFGAERAWETRVGASVIRLGFGDAWEVVLGRLPAIARSAPAPGVDR